MHPKYKFIGIRKSPSHLSTKWRGEKNIVSFSYKPGCRIFVTGIDVNTRPKYIFLLIPMIYREIKQVFSFFSNFLKNKKKIIKVPDLKLIQESSHAHLKSEVYR